MESDAMLAAGGYRSPARIIDRLLSGDASFDLELVAKWVPPLALINWRQCSTPQTEGGGGHPFEGIALLDALFRPLFQPAKCTVGSGDDRRLLFDAENNQLPPPAISRRLFNLICQGALDDAAQLARSRYLAVQCQTVGLPVTPDVDLHRIAAALLVPMRVGVLQSRFNRWVQPPKNASSRRTT
jgi:CRISPR-associated protein Csx17